MLGDSLVASFYKYEYVPDVNLNLYMRQLFGQLPHSVSHFRELRLGEQSGMAWIAAAVGTIVRFVDLLLC